MVATSKVGVVPGVKTLPQSSSKKVAMLSVVVAQSIRVSKQIRSKVNKEDVSVGWVVCVLRTRKCEKVHIGQWQARMFGAETPAAGIGKLTITRQTNTGRSSDHHCAGTLRTLEDT